jgi:hypothetical protein
VQDLGDGPPLAFGIGGNAFAQGGRINVGRVGIIGILDKDRIGRKRQGIDKAEPVMLGSVAVHHDGGGQTMGRAGAQHLAHEFLPPAAHAGKGR